MLRRYTLQAIEDVNIGTYGEVSKDIEKNIRSAPEGVPSAEVKLKREKDEKGQTTAVKVEMTSETKSYKVKIQREELSESLQKRKENQEAREREAVEEKSYKVFGGRVRDLLDKGYAEGRIADWDTLVARLSREERLSWSFGDKEYSIKNIKATCKVDDKGKPTYHVDYDIVCGEEARRIYFYYNVPIPFFIKKIEENKERKAEEIKARDAEAAQEAPEQVIQFMNDFLDGRKGKKRITDWETLARVLINASLTYKVRGVSYNINFITIDPVEQGEKKFKLSFPTAGRRLEQEISAETLVKKFEENKVLKNKEIKAEREAERSRGMSMGM